MNNKGLATQWIIVIVVAILLVVIGIYFVFQNINTKNEEPKPEENISKEEPVNVNTPSTATYIIDNKSIKLEEGVAGDVAIYGTSAQGDLNKDNVKDAASILFDSKKGTYYISAAIKNGENYNGTNAVPLSGNLSPKIIYIKDNLIIVDYVERKESDPAYDRFATSITQGFIFEDGTLKEVSAEVVSEKQCITSGGSVSTSFCCKSSKDFSNSCLIGACGCSPTNSREVKICVCPEGKCFNGNECISK